MSTKLVGILNLTPDSFSDGGKFLAPALALAQAEKLIKDGADILDVGAESTRPGAELLSAEEEWGRLELALAQIIRAARAAKVTISLDTRHPENAARGIKLGVDWINDESGLENPAMLELLAKANCKIVLMHSLGIPADPAKHLPESEDVIAHLLDWFEKRLVQLNVAGIARERIILDPGIGFGKTPLQSLCLLLNIGKLKKLGLPLFVGHSRKSFLTLFTEKPAAERDELTLAFSAMLAAACVEYIRVHEIAQHYRLLHRSFATMQHCHV